MVQCCCVRAPFITDTRNSFGASKNRNTVLVKYLYTCQVINEPPPGRVAAASKKPCSNRMLQKITSFAPGIVKPSAVAEMEEEDEGTAVEEEYRPQFHFTPRKGWMNDPNGLIHYQGKYHLFYQYSPNRDDQAGQNMHWGHATSGDLLHWEEEPLALSIQKEGEQYFSGCAIEDPSNTSDFQKKKQESPLILVFTKMEDGELSQCLALSYDEGKTFEEYGENPVIPKLENSVNLQNPIDPQNRDPNVFWHEPTKKWVMTLFIERKGERQFLILNSDDLKSWEETEHVVLGYYECPDLVKLPVDGNPNNSRWVIMDARNKYQIGSFDGRNFLADTDQLSSHAGPHYYAPQTWHQEPEGRTIQIGWMRTLEKAMPKEQRVFYNMPFNQQMSVPNELSLRTTSDGLLRLHRTPVIELEILEEEPLASYQDEKLSPDREPLLIECSEFRLRSEIKLGANQQIEFQVHGQNIQYVSQSLSLGTTEVPVSLEDGCLELDILADRTSVEVFAQKGRYALAMCMRPQHLQGFLLPLGQSMDVKSFELKPLKICRN